MILLVDFLFLHAHWLSSSWIYFEIISIIYFFKVYQEAHKRSHGIPSKEVNRDGEKLRAFPENERNEREHSKNEDGIISRRKSTPGDERRRGENLKGILDSLLCLINLQHTRWAYF